MDGSAWDRYEDRCRKAATVPGACGRGDDYLDLVEAIERGAVAGDGELKPPTGLREVYIVEGASWAEMERELLLLALDDAGSIRKAARSLGVARSTLGAWVRRLRD